MQLFCFPYAGGTADFFSQLAPWLGPSIKLVKLEYAGHGVRHREAPYRDFSQLADDLYTQLRRLRRPEEPYALFGYSMGSIAAAEVLARILREGDPPAHVFLAAHGPAIKQELLCFREDEADEWVRQRTVAMGGIPEKLMNNQTFWRIYLPLYRADYALLTKYDFGSLTLDCDIPLTGLYGENDLTPEEMQAWRRYFHGAFSVVSFPGNHFFMTGHCRETAALIERRLADGGMESGF